MLHLLAGSALISLSPIFIRLAKVPPDAAGFYRMLFAAISLLAWAQIARVPKRLPRRPLVMLAAGAILLGIDLMCWHRSIHLIGPGLSTLIANFQVFFTALFSWLVFRQRLAPIFLFAVLLALGGLFLITGINPGVLTTGTRIGIGLALVTALFYSGYILSLKQAMQHDGVSGVSAMLVVSTVCMFFMGSVNLLGGATFAIPDATSLLSLIGVGVLSTTVGWALISSALRQVPATLASLVLILQPTLSFVWDLLIFNRPLGGSEALGIGLILVAIYLGSRPQ